MTGYGSVGSDANVVSGNRDCADPRGADGNCSVTYFLDPTGRIMANVTTLFQQKKDQEKEQGQWRWPPAPARPATLAESPTASSPKTATKIKGAKGAVSVGNVLNEAKSLKIASN